MVPTKNFDFYKQYLDTDTIKALCRTAWETHAGESYASNYVEFDKTKYPTFERWWTLVGKRACLNM